MDIYTKLPTQRQSCLNFSSYNNNPPSSIHLWLACLRFMPTHLLTIEIAGPRFFSRLFQNIAISSNLWMNLRNQVKDTHSDVFSCSNDLKGPSCQLATQMVSEVVGLWATNCRSVTIRVSWHGGHERHLKRPQASHPAEKRKTSFHRFSSICFHRQSKPCT